MGKGEDMTDVVQSEHEDVFVRMGTEHTTKLLLEYSLPALAGLMVQVLYSVVDAIFIGNGVGQIGLAVTTVAFPMLTLMTALSMLVGTGGNALAAIRLGENNKQEAEVILGHCFTMLLVTSAVVFGISVLAMEPILRISGAIDEVVPLASSFLTILTGGFIFQAAGFGMNNFIRTTGAPMRAFLTMVVGAVCNIVLDYLFVIRFGWGIDGAAWATVIAWAVSAATVLMYFVSAKAPLRLRACNLRLGFHLDMRILALGMPAAILQLGTMVVVLFENHLLTFYGASDPLFGVDGALAVMSVLGRVGGFVVLPATAFALGSQPIIGFCYGARMYDRMYATLKQAIAMGIAVTTPLWAVTLVFPDAISMLFGLDQAYWDSTARFMIYYLALCPIIPIQIIGSNYFEATGQATKASLLTLTRQFIFLIPLLLWCPAHLPSLFPISSLESIFLSATISDVTSCLVVLVALVPEIHRLKARQAGEGCEHEDLHPEACV